VLLLASRGTRDPVTPLWAAVQEAAARAVPKGGCMSTTQFTPDQIKAKLERDQRFITEVRIVNDAGLREVMTSGWAQKGKLAWLADVVKRHRQDIQKILGD
jgi:hypothetical protein